MTTNFVAFNGIGRDPLVDAEKKLPVYNELVRALKAENKAIKAVRMIEEQIREDLTVIFDFIQGFLEKSPPMKKMKTTEFKIVAIFVSERLA